MKNDFKKLRDIVLALLFFALFSISIIGFVASPEIEVKVITGIFSISTGAYMTVCTYKHISEF